MGDKHDLIKYSVAKDISKDYPEIQKILDEFEKRLYNYNKYLCVTHILRQLQDTRGHIRLEYNRHKKVLDKKGKE